MRTFIEYYPGECYKELIKAMKSIVWLGKKSDSFTEAEREILSSDSVRAIRYFVYDDDYQEGDLVKGRFFAYEPYEGEGMIKFKDEILVKQDGGLRPMRFIKYARASQSKIVVLPDPKRNPTQAVMIALDDETYVLGRLIQDVETMTMG